MLYERERKRKRSLLLNEMSIDDDLNALVIDDDDALHFFVCNQ
jgi:hypothetical protein